MPSGMMYSAITEEDAKFIETWENISPITNYVIRLDIRGDERPEGVSGKRTFMISTKERLITQDRVSEEKYDPFLNGSFRPINVPPTINTDSNPNALSDQEIQSIFVSSDLAWGEWMKAIDSPETLRRMLDAADAADISLKRYRELERRLSQVSPPRRITQKDQDAYEKMVGTAAPTTPGGRKRPAL